MVLLLWAYPPTGRQVAATLCCFIVGASLIGVGAHLSLVNVAPQQARVQARNAFVKDYLRKLLDDSDDGAS